MAIKKRKSREECLNEEQKYLERKILRNLYIQKRNTLMHSNRISKEDIKEIREIIRKLRKLRGI